jgi:hypothetical protein
VNAPFRLPAPHGAPPEQAACAVVTASYAPDFERCRLLCETMDRHVGGMAHHYILVEGRDVALFRQLEGAGRTVVDERDILPSWLRVFDDPLSGLRRRIWLSLRTRPLRGWHVQQLRRIAIAAHVAQDVLIYCDSDVAFLRPLELSRFRQGGRTRLFRRDGALSREGCEEQRIWSRNAARALGLAPAPSAHDYITTLIAWDRATVVGMCRHIEAGTGRHWVSALGRDRRFSECMLYGRYVDDVLQGAGHFHAPDELCHVHWQGSALSDGEFRAFVARMGAGQVAIGMQSFIGTDLDRIRRLVLAA